MSIDDERPQQGATPDAGRPADPYAPDGSGARDGSAGAHGSADAASVAWRAFPGPVGTGVPLRVAMDRAPYAELVAHAKLSLESEICGVLVGDVCEDEEGRYLHIRATIPGSASTAGSTHVTFTHETWTAIHAEMEARYPQHRIVGWYHSHPGLGVVFSAMDVFIQENFFPGPAQVALVTDPLGGAEALCTNGPDGVQYIERFWVDGRERRTSMPDRPGPSNAGSAAGTVPAPVLERFEARITQALQTIEEQRRLLHAVVLTTAMVVAAVVIGFIGYNVYTHVWGIQEPPRLESYVPVPIQVGDETVLIGVGIVGWRVPPGVTAAYVKVEEQRRAQLRADSAARRPAARDTARARPEDTRRDSTP